MPRKLTRREVYLYRLTNSRAWTLTEQRRAIARAGLRGKTAADIDRIRRANWALRRRENPDVPVFVLGCQAAQDTRWAYQPPRGVAVGRQARCDALRRLAYKTVNWGRLRKHGLGQSRVWGAGAREDDNGKSGWDRVVWRYADYGCILSPDGRKVALSWECWRGRAVWVVVPCFRGRFKLAGEAVTIQSREPRGYQLRLRDCLQLLRRAGFTAYLTRQSKQQIAAGSGVRGRRGQLVLIVDFGDCGYYHAPCQENVVAVVQQSLLARRRELRQGRIDAWLAAGGTVFVGLDDSLAAGNCRPGTEMFARQVCQQLGGEVGGLRSDLLLSIRDDQFTRRAVAVAVLRRGVLEATG